MEKIRINEVCPKSSYNMLINFLNGYPTELFKSTECAMYIDRETNEKILLGEFGSMIYTGKQQKEEIGKTVLLCRNKKTGKVRLIETEIADMKPIINNNVDLSTTLDTSYLELSRKFGSKKHKKIVEQREKLKVNKQTLSDQMHNITVNIAEDQLDLSSYTPKSTDDFYIPPIERTAKKLDEVYDINKILSVDQYEKIYSELECTDYVSDMYPWIKNIVSDKMRQEFVVLAVYANTLFKLYLTMTKDINKKNFVICQYSATLNEIILKSFTTLSNNRRNRSLQLKDKSLCHAIVFLLIINNYKFDGEELSKHVKIAVKTLATKVRVTGATMVTTDDKKIIQLKLPLSTISFARRKSAKF